MNQNQPDPNDQTLNCRDCKQPFVFTVGEQKFFAERQFTPPTRCKACRQARKAAKDAETNGGGYNKVGGYTAAPPVVVEEYRGGGGGGGGEEGKGGGRRGGGRGGRRSRHDGNGSDY